MKIQKKQLNLVLLALFGAILIIIFFKFDISAVKEMLDARPDLVFPVLFFLFFLGSHILLPITPITVLTVSLVPPLDAYILVVSSTLLGAITSYFLSARLGRKRVHAELAKSGYKFDKLNSFLGKYGVTAVLVARIVPLLPFSIWNYLFGFSTINFGQYLIGSIIGLMFVEGLYIYVISGFITFTPASIVISLAIILLFGYIIRQIKAKFDKFNH